MQISYYTPWIQSTVTQMECGCLIETEGARRATVYVEDSGPVESGTIFPSLHAWIDHMETDMARRAPWFAGKYYRLSAGEDVILWIGREGQYRDVRKDCIRGLDKHSSSSGYLPTLYSLMG
jgi:hypothetical protein